MCDALRFMNLLLTFFIDKPFINSIQLHFEIDKPFLHFIVLCPKVDGDLCGHFFLSLITLHLEDFDFFPNASLSTSIVDFNSEVFFSILTLCPYSCN